MVAAPLLVVALALGDHVTFNSSVRAEGRGAVPVVGSDTALVPEVQIQPALDLGYVTGSFRAQLGYHPQLSFTGLDPGYLHRVGANGEWRLAASRRATVDQQFSFGQYDSTLSDLGGDGGFTLPDYIVPLGKIDQFSSETTATLDGAIAARVRLRASAGYRASGGLTEEARLSLPIQHGPFTGLELAYAPTRRNTYTAGLRVSATRTTVVRIVEGVSTVEYRTSGIAEGLLSWTTLVTRGTELLLGAGVAAVGTMPDGGALTSSAVPVGSAGLSYSLPRLRLALDARLSPQADAQSGKIYQQAGAIFTVESRPRNEITVRTSGGGNFSLSGDNRGDRTILGEASIGYREEPLEISVGVRVADAVLSTAPTPHALEVRAFVGISVQGPRVR